MTEKIVELYHGIQERQRETGYGTHSNRTGRRIPKPSDVWRAERERERLVQKRDRGYSLNEIVDKGSDYWTEENLEVTENFIVYGWKQQIDWEYNDRERERITSNIESQLNDNYREVRINIVDADTHLPIEVCFQIYPLVAIPIPSVNYSDYIFDESGVKIYAQDMLFNFMRLSGRAYVNQQPLDYKGASFEMYLAKAEERTWYGRLAPNYHIETTCPEYYGFSDDISVVKNNYTIYMLKAPIRVRIDDGTNKSRIE